MGCQCSKPHSKTKKNITQMHCLPRFTSQSDTPGSGSPYGSHSVSHILGPLVVVVGCLVVVVGGTVEVNVVGVV